MLNLKTKNYQWLYIIPVAIFTGVVVNRFSFYLNLELGLEHNWIREFFISFGVIVIIMFFEHLRRCKRLGVSILMTASWVMFRTVALGIVLILSI